MPEFDAADVRGYYDRNTGNFVAHGEGGAAGALHRAVWAPGVDDAHAAFHYVEDRLIARLGDLPSAERPAHVVDLGCGVGGSLCYLAARVPIRGTGLTLSPVQVRHAERRIRNAGLSDRVRCRGGRLLRAADRHAPRRPRVRDRVAGPRTRSGPLPRRVRPDGPAGRAAGDLRRFSAAGRRPGGAADGRTIPARVASQHPAPSLKSCAPSPERAGFAHLSTDDLTPHLRLGRPRDRAAALFIALCGWLPLDRTRFGHLVGGTALQTCLAKGMDGIRSRAVPPDRRCGRLGRPRSTCRRFRRRDAGLSAAWPPAAFREYGLLVPGADRRPCAAAGGPPRCQPGSSDP